MTNSEDNSITRFRMIQNIDTDVLGTLRNIVSPHRTLSEIVAWVASLGNKDGLTDIVTQDEYTHDVVVKFTEQVYLVYDVT